MMFEKEIKQFDEAAEFLRKVDMAIVKHGNDFDAIGREIGINLGAMIDPPTPLSDTPELAKLEAEMRLETNKVKLDKAIQQRLENILNG